jgi:hypothetical protein
MCCAIGRSLAVVFCLLGSAALAGEDPPVPLAPGVRGLVTRSPGAVILDGNLREWSEAFCTPVHYAHGSLHERAAQFFYMWDDEAFYLGLRCLDSRQANPGPPEKTWDGDAVEFYIDTRPGPALRGKDWADGAIHLHFSAFRGTELQPRWVIRQGIATSATKLAGVEIAASKTPASYELEFKIPWRNFPKFEPKPGAVLALDAELCSGDGDKRVDRTFAYGSPLSVQQPASLGKVELVRAFDPDYFAAVGPAAFPLWVDTPWNQTNRATVRAVVAIPPEFIDIIGMVEFRVHDVNGVIVKTLESAANAFGPSGLGFARSVAHWSVDDYAPGAYFVTARVVTRTGKTLTTVAPRLLSEAIVSGR